MAALSAPGKLKPRVENPDQPTLFAKQAAPQPDDVGSGLFDTAAERQAREDAQSHEDKLLGDQLTAQFKSGLPMRPAKIKPKKAGNLFEDQGPEQGGLFSRRYEPDEIGERGPVSRQFRNDEVGATKALEDEQSGEALGALEENRFGYGPVDLVWGYKGIAPPEWERGYGLAHILVKHKYMRGHLQEMLDRMTHVKRQGERAMFSNDQGEHATLALSWFGRERKTWLLTEYDQRPPAAENILFGSGNPESGASEPSSPLTGSSDTSVTQKPKGETGAINAPILTSLPAWFATKLGLGPDDAPKVTYSGLGALRSRFIPGGNLGQLEHASVPAFEAATRTAGSSAQSGVIMHAAWPPISRALQGSGLSPSELRLAYTSAG